MEKNLVLAGLPVVFTAPADDYYLRTLPPQGPPDLEAVFRTFCQPGDDFVDIGANIGVTAVLAGRLVAPGRVVALEPVSSTFTHLQHNVSASGLSNVTCLQLGAASNPGDMSLVSRPGYGFAAFVGQADGLEGYTDNPAQAVSLDQLVVEQGLHHLRFVKIDVEGYELEVLRGAKKVLDTAKPVVFLESNPYCLSVFHNISLVDFTAEVVSLFPFVYALDFSAGVTVIDLTVRQHLPEFYHESFVNNRFPNLVCGFDADISERLKSIGYEAPREAVGPGPVAGPGSDHAASMALSRRETELILWKRRVMTKLNSFLSAGRSPG